MIRLLTSDASLRKHSLGTITQSVTNWQNGVVDQNDPTDTDLITETIYDAGSRRSAQIGTDGKRTNYSYDGLDRLTSVVENASGGVSPSNVTTSYGYDRRGLLKSATDPLSHQKSWGYNAAGWLTSQTDGLNRTTTFGYGRGGRRTSVPAQPGTQRIEKELSCWCHIIGTQSKWSQLGHKMVTLSQYQVLPDSMKDG